MGRVSVYFGRRRLECSHLLHQLALQVRSLVSVDDISLCEFIDHAHHFGQQCLRFLLVCFQSQLLNRITRGFVLVPVSQTNCVIPSDSL